MKEPVGTFPFGQPVEIVEQQDQEPGPVFVLGVYASAVHAKWKDAAGRTVVKALAVASEPYIFWRGDGAVEIIERIEVPPELGSLVPAAPQLNGPSGKALDDQFLQPLGYGRSEAWLCDLVPHACMNAGQFKAVQREYWPLMVQHDLPRPTVPPVPRQLTDAQRREAIADELASSAAEVLVTLGDEPLKWFVTHVAPVPSTLRAFGDSPSTYGRLHAIEVRGKRLHLLPLVHPRQAARLGPHSREWAAIHEEWSEKRAPTLL
jgi:uracil-DNA glycosylase